MVSSKYKKKTKQNIKTSNNGDPQQHRLQCAERMLSLHSSHCFTTTHSALHSHTDAELFQYFVHDWTLPPF